MIVLPLPGYLSNHKRKRNLITMRNIFPILFIGALLSTAGAVMAQNGTLRGGSVALDNGVNTITIAPPTGLLESYTFTLPSVQSVAGQFLGVNNGLMSWGIPVADALNSGALLISPITAQLTTHNNQYLFNVQYASGAVGPLPGVVLVSEINNPNPSCAALHVKAKNTNASATGVTVKGIIVNVTNNGSGTQTGLMTSSSSLGTNYSLLLTGTSGTLCGIGTATPSENLEVGGNIRISGVNGLKITEWVDPLAGASTSGAMGKVTLGTNANAAGTYIVKTSSVTANSRIFLTTQTPTNPGQLYVSARTAGTSFTISSTSGTDASVVAWLIVEP